MELTKPNLNGMKQISFAGQLTEAEFRTINSLATRKIRWVLGVLIAIPSIWTYFTATASEVFPVWIFLPLMYGVSMFEAACMLPSIFDKEV